MNQALSPSLSGTYQTSYYPSKPGAYRVPKVPNSKCGEGRGAVHGSKKDFMDYHSNDETSQVAPDVTESTQRGLPAIVDGLHQNRSLEH